MANPQHLEMLKRGVEAWNQWRSMANPEHLEILKRGVEAWNQWRSEHPDIFPGLRGANLRRANLSGANLSRAFLFKANLSGANLGGANLSMAFLFEAKLSEANLSGVNLSDAHLDGANLRKADLSGALLVRTHFSGANLSGAILSGTDFSEVIIFESDVWQLPGRKCERCKQRPAEWGMQYIGSDKPLFFDLGCHGKPIRGFRLTRLCDNCKEGEFERAIADYDRTIELDPDATDAHYNRGLAYYSNGDFDRAIADFRKVLEMSVDPELRAAAEERLRILEP